MTSQELRLTRPGELPAPRADADSAAVLAQAADALAALRMPCWLGDSTVGLHALASLITQAQQMLPATVSQARDQEHTWAEIGQLLSLSPATAARRYRNHPMINLTRITRIMVEDFLHHVLRNVPVDQGGSQRVPPLVRGDMDRVAAFVADVAAG